MASIDYGITERKYGYTSSCTERDMWIEKPRYEATGIGWDIENKSKRENIYNDLSTIGLSTINNLYYKGTDTSTYSNIWREYDTGTGADATTIYNNGLYKWDTRSVTWSPPVVAPGDRIRQMIRDRMGPTIRRSRTSLSIAMDVREERARQTLRRIIGEQAFRKFVRDGFITVVPKSGLTYRIYPGHGITEVYDKGIMVDRLCVVLQGNFPPTDSILMRYLLILNDEGEFSKYAVKHMVLAGTGANLVLPGAEAPTLTEAWAKLKVA